VFSSDDLIEAAKRESGLTSFGGDSYREGLEILVASLRDEANLTPVGENFLKGRLLNRLVSRLQIEEWYTGCPETEEVPITAPLFGLGLPRTGSTALSFLLAQDPDIRYLRMWEALRPFPPPSTVAGSDPRLTAPNDWALPAVTKHVPMDATGPMADMEILALDFKTVSYYGSARMPTYTDWLRDADLTSAYLYQRRTLKMLQWGEPPRPWRLKMPAHMLWLDYLINAFPDARFVMTHRDPTDVMLSVCSMIAEMQSAFTAEVDLLEIGRSNLLQWTTGIQRVMNYRDEFGDARFYDIDFRAMRADPIGEIKRLYAWLGEPVSPEFDRRMRDWWTQNSANREPRGSSDPIPFGLDLDEIRASFAEYVRRAERWTDHSRSLTK